MDIEEKDFFSETRNPMDIKGLDIDKDKESTKIKNLGKKSQQKLLLPNGETTKDQLSSAMYSFNIMKKLCSSKLGCDEVFPRLYISNYITARAKGYIKNLGITHILNVAEKETISSCNAYYSDEMIVYLGLPLLDSFKMDINKYFPIVANFIDEALFTGGKVLVHCKQGLSRSPTCIIAFLMLKRNMLAIDAMKCVSQNRPIWPNMGFLHQLAQLDNQLRKKWLRNHKSSSSSNS